MAYGADLLKSETEQTQAADYAPRCQKPVDLVHLSRQTFGSKELEKEVLGLFVNHSVQCLKRLQDAATDKDWADAAHSIKGSARAIGAWEVGDIAEGFERRSIAGEQINQVEAANEIETLIKKTNSYITELMKNA